MNVLPGPNSGQNLPQLDFQQINSSQTGPLSRQTITVSVPRLDDLIIKALAENYDVYPALDRIPPEYLDNVVALLDPSQIDFVVAAKYITTEKFWKRLCRERWPICQVDKHGLSYKRLYIERHIQSLFEAYYPSLEHQNYIRLSKEVDAGKAFVHTVNIQQLLSHLDLCKILTSFPNLSTLYLKYGARKLGMDYDKSLFGMQLADAMSLAKFFTKTRTLNRLRLSENLLNDESVHILMSGLYRNDTITYLDLSHNKIGDIGAKRICNLIERNAVLTHLDLNDNNIHADGAALIGHSLRSNYVLQTLNLRLNPIDDNGGRAILTNLTNNTVMSNLDLAATSMGVNAGKAFADLLQKNEALTEIDISCNDMFADGGKNVLEALERNESITKLDVRENNITEGVAKQMRAVLKKRFAKEKRLKRLAYQDGWDEAL